MTHLDDGTLQAFLDDELPPRERAEVAEHLLACAACQAAHEELMQANGLFSRSVSLLDVEPPQAAALGRVVRQGARTGTSWFVKAAGLVLFLAAAASAAVPGSPVREWIAHVVEPEAPAPVETSVGAPEPEPVSASADAGVPVPIGLSLAPAAGQVVVALDAIEGAVLRLEPIDGSRARVSVVAAGRDPVFRTRAGRVEVRDLAGAAVRVQLPMDAPRARLEVGGRLYAEQVGGELRVLVQADTVDGAFVWR